MLRSGTRAEAEHIDERFHRGRLVTHPVEDVAPGPVGEGSEWRVAWNNGCRGVHGNLVCAATGSWIAAVANDTSFYEGCYSCIGKADKGITSETYVGFSIVDADVLVPVLDAVRVYAQGEAEAAASIAVVADFAVGSNGANELGCQFACQSGETFGCELMLGITSMDKGLAVFNGFRVPAVC